MAENEIGTALTLKKICKSFSRTNIVKSVDFNVRAGEVHALVGENGAGKSTLMKIIGGSFNDYDGEILVNGKNVRLNSPGDSKCNGIEMIHQELSLAQSISVCENMFAGRLPSKKGIFLDKKAMLKKARENLERVGLGHIDPLLPISSLSQHEAQLVEVAKALSNNPCILVMDEPTSALSREEVERLFEIIEKLKRQGLAIIYISHHLYEVFHVADRISVMRDGKKVNTFDKKDITPEKLVELMVGRNIADFYAKRQAQFGEELLKVDNISRFGFFHNVSFSVRKGEILGICGLAGAGRSELMRSICGIDPLDSGDVYLYGNKIKIKNLSQAIKNKINYLTENRKTEGLALKLSVGENLISALVPEHTKAMVYSEKRGEKIIEDYIKELLVNPPDPHKCVVNLSGGNQQKVLLAKWLATGPRILILDEPTRGVDVGAKEMIHKAIVKHVEQGNSVVLVSSDLPELLGLSDRIIIMRQGRLKGEIPNDCWCEESLLLAVNGEGDTL